MRWSCFCRRLNSHCIRTVIECARGRRDTRKLEVGEIVLEGEGMKRVEIQNDIVNYMEKLEVIDAHEHLPPEAGRTELDVDIFTLFSNYTAGDLSVAGMSARDYYSLFDRDIPVEKRWQTFLPYWEKIRFGSYARAVLISAAKFYGCDNISEKTYRKITEAMKAANKPGIYEHILKKTCNIQTVLSENIKPEEKTSLLTPIVRIRHKMNCWDEVHFPHFAENTIINSVDDYINSLKTYVNSAKALGAVGVKIMSAPYRDSDKNEAVRTFEELRKRKKLYDIVNPLRDYVVNELICHCCNENIPVAVHTGYWGDFRQLDPLHMIPFIQKYPSVRFDIYHLGYPWVRETLMLAKGFANVWLNLCWTHIVSQRCAVQALDEAIDLIPINKIIAFGGDYNVPVENVYGHLTMAKENIAKVLSLRITEGQMKEVEAYKIAKKWFWDNPKELYGI